MSARELRSDACTTGQTAQSDSKSTYRHEPFTTRMVGKDRVGRPPRSRHKLRCDNSTMSTRHLGDSETRRPDRCGAGLDAPRCAGYDTTRREPRSRHHLGTTPPTGGLTESRPVVTPTTPRSWHPCPRTPPCSTTLRRALRGVGHSQTLAVQHDVPPAAAFGCRKRHEDPYSTHK